MSKTTKGDTEVESRPGTDWGHDQIKKVLQKQRKNRFKIHSTTAEERITKLKKIEEYILEHRKEIQNAIHADFSKPASEVDLSEIYATLMEIRHARKNLKDWMFPEHVAAPLSIFTTKSHIRYQPKGVVLIIAPWNFPFVLTVAPLISAIAAGNCVVLKPSELTPNTSRMLEKMVKDLFSEDEVALFRGDKQVAQALLAQRFDHIFFTGSPRVGKIVMKAAAEHLTSVTLELGGKSPGIVDKSANLDDAADKIVWGKFVNAGQTCIAPDYLLVHQNIKNELLEHLSAKLSQRYGDEVNHAKQSANYTSIVNTQHFERLKKMLDSTLEEGAELVTGGSMDKKSCFMSPTVLHKVNKTMPVMQEEIFGPLLPVLTYETKEQATAYVNSRPNPLALYVFSNDNDATEYFLENTSAGGSCVNETLLQFMNNRLPFGGAGNSGIGKSHGKYGYRAFSNERPVLKSPSKLSPTKLFYPPYTPKVKKMIGWLIKYF